MNTSALWADTIVIVGLMVIIIIAIVRNRQVETEAYNLRESLRMEYQNANEWFNRYDETQNQYHRLWFSPELLRARLAELEANPRLEDEVVPHEKLWTEEHCHCDNCKKIWK